MKNRAVGTAVMLAFAALVAAAVTAASAGPASAGARGAAGSSDACPSLRTVIGFAGTVSVTDGVSDTGASPPNGTQTIQLARAMVNVRLHLGHKLHADKTTYEFKGMASGGKVMVDDVFDDTGADVGGELKWDQPANGVSEGGLLAISRAGCAYKLNAGATVLANYTGEPEADNGHLVAFGATSNAHPIPENLRLQGSDTLDVSPECTNPFEGAQGCATFGSGWMVELITLHECGTSDPNYGAAEPSGKCPYDENPKFSTPASLSWDLKPIFEKGSKK